MGGVFLELAVSSVAIFTNKAIKTLTYRPSHSYSIAITARFLGHCERLAGGEKDADTDRGVKKRCGGQGEKNPKVENTSCFVLALTSRVTALLFDFDESLG